MHSEPASFLTIPSELRNAIYLYIFADDNVPETSTAAPTTASFFSLPGAALIPTKFDPRSSCCDTRYSNSPSARKLAVLRTCRQIHSEATLLALSLTPFHIIGGASDPDLFDQRSRPLSHAQIGAIRHLTLTARISHLRALNEAWAGLPFGHACLDLDCLTIVPRRPDCSSSAYAEIADLSQCHTLAYIFAETFKGLKNVKVVEVRNHGCFNAVVWRIVYRSLVYRLWRWGGERCGLRFECSSAAADGRVVQHDDQDEQDAWFKVHLRQAVDVEVGREVGEEVRMLAGGDMPEIDDGVVGL